MDEEKKINSITEEITGSNNDTDDKLNNELEELAEIFRHELKKAQQEAELKTDEEAVDGDSNIEDAIPEEELCSCCGEKRRSTLYGKSYEYCDECRANMTRYPLSFINIVTLCLVFALSIVSLGFFAKNFEGYYYAYKAEKALQDNEIYTAINYLDYSIYELKENNIKAQRLYIKCAESVFSTMKDGTNSMENISLLIDAAVTEKQAESIVYKDVRELYRENQIMYATMQEFYLILQTEEYTQFEPGDEKQYSKLMSDIEAIADKTVTIPKIGGKATEEAPASKVIVRFCQYMFAMQGGKYEESLGYMRMIRELKPEYYWLYAYDLGIAELKEGNVKEARTLASEMLQLNAEDPNAYNLRSTIDRVNKRYDKAVAWTDKGMEYTDVDPELYRNKAMAYCAAGDYKQAKSTIDDLLSFAQYAQAYTTAIVIENELGNTDKVSEYKDILTNEGLTIPEKLQSYLKGDLTAQQLFTEGAGDIEWQ